MIYFPTIGLEIHIELNTESKMFCNCKNELNQENPNTNICPVCLAHPGTLPVANGLAVQKLLKTAMALDCEICNVSRFERKNYFYPDLPKGYQISQYALPMAKSGWLDIENQRIGIERIHLEEDTGKLLHSESEAFTFVDFNRAGVPLMELVSKPDIHSAKEASQFVKELQLLLRYLDVSDGDMEKGQLRCEVNISLAKEGSAKLGTKVEIKNLNSVKSVERAIEYEIKRQADILEKGDKVVQETRGFHDTKQITFSQRAKEEAHDYRYFPEPDLPMLSFTKEYLQKIKAQIQELPQARKERLKKEYLLDETTAQLYVAQKELGDYFESVVSELKAESKTGGLQKSIKIASNYISTDLQNLIKEKKENKITPENFAEFVNLIALGEISSKIAKIILLEMFETGVDPSQIIESKGLKQIGDTGEIEKLAQEVIKANPQPAQDYKAGKQNSLQFLVGCVIAKSQGKANPLLVVEELKKQLAL